MWNKKRFSRTALLLLIAGALLQAAAGLALLRGAELLQYSIPAPDVQRVSMADGSVQLETGIETLAGAREEIEADLGEAVSALSIHGMRTGMAVSSDARSAEATLLAVGERHLETCPQPLASGRWMDGNEIATGAQVALLDEDLAFELFGSEEAEGRMIWIDQAQYRVIGVLRRSRGVGDVDAYRACIPLSAVEKQGLQLETITMNALPAGKSGLRQSFQSAMNAKWGGGSLHDLRKEAMGALLLSRLLLFALGMVLLACIGGFWKRLFGKFGAQISAKKARHYARRWLWPALWRVGLLALLGGLWLLAAYGLLAFLIQPVYTFTEWVPESLVSLSALKAVFWSRTAEAARAVQISTPESARIAFWGLIARWGAVAFLLGMALGKKNMEKSEKIGNKSGRTAV